jgi:predicted Zn-dependent protease
LQADEGVNGESKQEVPKPAPAPPPPADLALAMGATRGSGFNPHQGRALAEVVVFVGVVVALGALAYYFAGFLAAWATPLVPTAVDRKLGQAAQTQLALVRGDCSERATAYVATITRPLLDAAGPLPFEFEFVVQKDESVNAFALPGGFVTVNSGLLAAAESGEEVAGVLSHEIQHALLRHGTRRMLRELGGGMVLSLLTFGWEPTGLGALAGRLTSLSYDRGQESEADARGVDLLLRAGVDPRGLVRFFERLAHEGGPTPPMLLSTHPDPGARGQLARRVAAGGTFRRLPSPPRPVCDP